MRPALIAQLDEHGMTKQRLLAAGWKDGKRASKTLRTMIREDDDPGWL